MLHLKKHFFLYIILVLTVFAVAASFTRFLSQQDYLVSYEGDCDPYTESCYVCGPDDGCDEVFYYSVIERYASEIHALCGPDVTVCDDAYYCGESVEHCEIFFCDPIIDGEEYCDDLPAGDYQEELTDF